MAFDDSFKNFDPDRFGGERGWAQQKSRKDEKDGVLRQQ